MSKQSPIPVDVKDWLRTAKFGPVQVGMSADALYRRFGVPDDVGGTSRKYRKPSIWKYGDVEFYLDRETDLIVGIVLKDFDIPTGGERIALEPWILRKGLPLGVIVGALDEEQIPHHLDDRGYNLALSYVKTHPAISLVFAVAPGTKEQRVLYAISHRFDR